MKRNIDRKQSLRKGFAWDLLGGFVKKSSAVLISIVLARLLGPKDFGLIGMALVFISLSEVFVDVGFTSGIIQAKTINSNILSSIFFLNFGLSVFFSTLIFFNASLIGNFFGSTELITTLQYLVFVLPIYALGKVHAALLAKNMNFKSLALRDIIATIISGVIGILLAFNNFGVNSLVLQQLVFAFLSTTLLWVSTSWRPNVEFSFKEIKELMSFSSFVFFDALLQQLFKKIDTIFVGKVFSPVVLGFYSRAESFNSLINAYSTSSLNKVIYPLLSSVQDNQKKFEEILAKSISLSVFVTTTIVGFLFFTADFLILFLLGPKWGLSVVIFKILIFNTVTLSINSILNKAILSKGFSKLKFKVLIFIRILYLLSMPFGYYYGVEAFASAFTVIRFITIAINWFYFKEKLGVNLFSILEVILYPLAILFVWIAIYYSGLLVLPNYLFLLFFVLTYFTTLYLVRNSGLMFMINEGSRVYKNSFKFK